MNIYLSARESAGDRFLSAIAASSLGITLLGSAAHQSTAQFYTAGGNIMASKADLFSPAIQIDILKNPSAFPLKNPGLIVYLSFIVGIAVSSSS